MNLTVDLPDIRNTCSWERTGLALWITGRSCERPPTTIAPSTIAVTTPTIRRPVLGRAPRAVRLCPGIPVLPAAVCEGWKRRNATTHDVRGLVGPGLHQRVDVRAADTWKLPGDDFAEALNVLGADGALPRADRCGSVAAAQDEAAAQLFGPATWLGSEAHHALYRGAAQIRASVQQRQPDPGALAGELAHLFRLAPATKARRAALDDHIAGPVLGIDDGDPARTDDQMVDIAPGQELEAVRNDRVGSDQMLLELAAHRLLAGDSLGKCDVIRAAAIGR
jgi:hypothetical protein